MILLGDAPCDEFWSEMNGGCSDEFGQFVTPGASGGGGSTTLDFSWLTGGAGSAPVAASANPSQAVIRFPWFTGEVQGRASVPGGAVPAGGLDDLAQWIKERSAIVWLGLAAVVGLSLVKGKR
jgi:hypothetical protein